MKTLILGGGFGGIVAAHTLRNTLRGEHEVTLVSQSSDFYVRGAFPGMAFEGGITPENIRLRLDKVLPARGINFRKARVTAIRPERNMVETSDGFLGYDYLIIALGTDFAVDKVPGLMEYGYSLWTVDEAQRLGARLKSFTGGSVVTGTALGSPCEGPMWEVTMLMDRWARQRGIRDKVEIHHITPKALALQPVGPAGHRWGKETFGKLGIHVHTNAEVVQVTPQGRIVFRDGLELQSDLTLIIPPYVGYPVVAKAGLGDENGFVLVESNMRTRTHRNVFAIGDCVSMPQRPKMSHNAMRGGVVAALNIAHEIMGKLANWEHHNEIMCVIDNGGGKGTYVRSNVPWGGSVSVVMGAHADTVGLSAEEAHFIKKAFGEYFLATGGNVGYYIM
jgi:sulfide:quinone oxidoreductase